MLSSHHEIVRQIAVIWPSKHMGTSRVGGLFFLIGISGFSGNALPTRSSKVNIKER